MEKRKVLSSGVGTLIANVIGWGSIIGGVPAGMLLAAEAETPWGAAGWMGAGFAGLVSGYLLVWFLPEERRQAREERALFMETIKTIATEHKESTKMAVDGNRTSFNEAADKIVVATHDLRDSILKALLEDRDKA